jgi:hypothetical protein
MVHGDQSNVATDAYMSLVCLFVWCLSPFALLVFWCLEEDEQHQGPHQLATMVSSKSNMTKAYFKRFQIKYRHMWARKTNYQVIICLTIQDKNKYITPKYCYVVRFTNKDIVTQITS